MESATLLMMLFAISCLAVLAASPGPGKVHQPQVGMSGPPYFNFEIRNMLIEGSHRIIPAAPIAVGKRRQLLMDKYLVETTWNCFRTVHPPEKYPGNPLMTSPQPGVDPFDRGTILYDEATGRYRMWTRYLDSNLGKYGGGMCNVYYESADGLEWTAPKLDIVPDHPLPNAIQGGKGMMIHLPSVVEVPPRLAHKGRYAMTYGRFAENLPPGDHGAVYFIAWSDDGIHWTDQPENPILRGRSDTFNNMVYNPDRDVFMMYRRSTVNAHEIRRIAYTESKDLIAWSQPVTILDPDELDAPFLYSMAVVPYQGIYLGFLQMFYAANAGYKTGPRYYKDGRCEKEGHLDIQLAWSRDGMHWDRHPQRPIFLANGPHGTYDWGMISVAQGIFERGDRLHFYYNGSTNLHKPYHSGPPGTGSLLLATLRRDGFVSLDTPGVGYVLTKPLLNPEGKLHLNCKTNPGGSVRVAVRRGDGERDGDWIHGFMFDDADPFSGDTVDTVYSWQGKPDVSQSKGQAIRLHFWLERAELYSFWFGE